MEGILYGRSVQTDPFVHKFLKVFCTDGASRRIQHVVLWLVLICFWRYFVRTDRPDGSKILFFIDFNMFFLVFCTDGASRRIQNVVFLFVWIGFWRYSVRTDREPGRRKHKYFIIRVAKHEPRNESGRTKQQYFIIRVAKHCFFTPYRKSVCKICFLIVFSWLL